MRKLKKFFIELIIIDHQKSAILEKNVVWDIKKDRYP